jgi:hypothetical protein
MGPGTPKRDELLAELEHQVKDTILVGGGDDLYLQALIEVVLVSIVKERPLYQTVLEEPAFLRKYFRPWVEEGLEERRAYDKAGGASPPALPALT